jgi:glycosyltransferase involved in cell wall biosynthesis
MRIVFIHPHKAFLPEIEAYRRFFEGHGLETSVARTGDNLKAEVEWHFMGWDPVPKKKGIIKIHEFASSSVAPMANWKNLSKRWLASKPDYRIFLNDYVGCCFGFGDEIPFGYRDMGIAEEFFLFEQKQQEKNYDFVYAGSLSPDRKIEMLIRSFGRQELKNHSLLLIGREGGTLRKKFRQYHNVIFQGPVQHADIPDFLSQCSFALNYVPDMEPFNRQTSTKLLEYAAMGIPIITTDYPWVREFQKKWGGNYYFLDGGLNNFRFEQISQFPFSFPDMKDWAWENQIRGSGVLEYLKSCLRGLNF